MGDIEITDEMIERVARHMSLNFSAPFEDNWNELQEDDRAGWRSEAQAIVDVLFATDAA